MKTRSEKGWAKVAGRPRTSTTHPDARTMSYAAEGLSASLDSMWIMKALLGAPAGLIPGSPATYWKVIQDTLRLRSVS